MMIKINCTNRVNQQNINNEQGFSLIETMIALTTLGVCLAYAMPLFLYAKINNSKSEVRAGALFVAQRLFDDIRSKPFSEMPFNDGLVSGKTYSLQSCTNLAGSPGKPPSLIGCKNADTPTTPTTATLPNPVIIPNVVDITKAKLDSTAPKSSGDKISPADNLLTNAFGRQYQTKVSYCEGMDVTPAPNPPICSEKNRKFKVEVSYNGSKVYDLEGTYTDFQ
jgi:prepilin-type N-terminal cleavage/methylation domain-containing protein